MKDSSPVDRIHSARLFNEMMLFDRKSGGHLSHISYTPANYAKRDHMLQMVISTFNTTDWQTTYGLNITETMQLEFGSYVLMVEELRKLKAIMNVQPKQPVQPDI